MIKDTDVFNINFYKKEQLAAVITECDIELQKKRKKIKRIYK